MDIATKKEIGVSSDLTFITNEKGQHLSNRFAALLGDNTRFFDCLVGYFFISAPRRAPRLAPAASSRTPPVLPATACPAPLSPPERTG